MIEMKHQMKDKLSHFNLTLSRQFVHSLNELCCNTELGVIHIALRIAYFEEKNFF